jgi:hypothetical protein
MEAPPRGADVAQSLARKRAATLPASPGCDLMNAHLHDDARLTPIAKAALLAALTAQGHTLKRTPSGFAPARVGNPCSFTRRAINKLVRNGLMTFDDPGCPSEAALSHAGVAMARRITPRYAAGKRA